MGIFDIFKKKKEQPVSNMNMSAFGNNAETANSQQNMSQPDAFQLLNLEKGDILDLNKYSESLRKIRASAGWKIGDDSYDLDLCAYLCDETGRVFDTVYYNSTKSPSYGISLDGDDLTGSVSGQDNENIMIDFQLIPKKTKDIYIAVVIYEAQSRRQAFEQVRDAYIRLVDIESGNVEICRYSMSNSGGKNTAVLVGKLIRGNTGWSFNAIGTYSQDSIPTLRDKVSSMNRR